MHLCEGVLLFIEFQIARLLQTVILRGRDCGGRGGGEEQGQAPGGGTVPSPAEKLCRWGATSVPLGVRG